MATFIIENFSNGLDLRKSANTAPPGSLRILRNCFINEGGEIEKRKAFGRHVGLTAYAQDATFKGKVTGPHPIASQGDAVFFHHRADALPGGSWQAGAGSVAKFFDISGTSDRPMIAWAMKSTVALSAPSIGIMYASSVSAFADHTHLFESWYSTSFTNPSQHLDITHAASGEPTSESEVSANANRPNQMTLKGKGYVVSGNTLYASAVNDPADMAGTGSGSLDARTQSVSIARLRALAEYFGQLVTFGDRGAQFWEVDPDFTQNQYLRTIPLNLFGRRTVFPYAFGDLLYLASNGVRSLRAQDSSNTAHVQDVGSPIDKLIRAALNYTDSVSEAASETEATVRKNAFFYPVLPTVAIHPQTGQFWLCLRRTVYVLSVFPDAKVRAWSTFDLPEPASISLEKYGWVADICPIRNDLIFRNFDDEVYIYGGTTGAVYDATEAEVVTPYMDMGSPSTSKTLHSVDVACEGTWTIEISTDVDNEDWQELGTVTESTHRLGDMVPIDMELTHFALRLTSTTSSAATVGQIAITYSGGEEK